MRNCIGQQHVKLTLGVDCQIHALTAGFGNPAGAVQDVFDQNRNYEKPSTSGNLTENRAMR